MKRAAAFALAVFVAAPRPVTAQADRERGAAALGELIRGLGVTARVLMIGAHPDDEDTQLITWLARGRGIATAYLSLTRGDGGQNLIGNELGEALGVIRTEELLAARRIDGGWQYFTRAYDFGFSKSAEETYRHWPKDSILRDVVTVVRAFRPHVIVSVFSGTPRDGHGHHQVAGLLAREAYDVASDTVRFPREPFDAPWTPLKFYRSARFSPPDATLRFDVGEFSPLLGRSYAEIAAVSRSQHKSQGFGSLQRRGPVLDYLRLEASRPGAAASTGAEGSIFDGIDTSWARFRSTVTEPRARAALDSLPAAFAAIRAAFDAFAPERLIPPLTRAQSLLRAVCPTARENACQRIDPDTAARVLRGTFRDSDLAWSIHATSVRLEEALRLASGATVEAFAPRELWRVGSTARVATAFYNRGRDTVAVGGPWATGRGPGGLISGARYVPPGAVLRDTIAVSIDSVAEPWWLREPRRGDLFATRIRPGGEGVGLDLQYVAYFVDLGGHSMGTMLRVFEPVLYRYADPVRGEVARPVAGAPAVSVTLDRTVEYAAAGAPLDHPLRVRLRTVGDAPGETRVTLTLPTGLTADSSSRTVSLPPGAQRDVTFRLRGHLPAGRHRIEVLVESGGQRFSRGYQLVDYEHIRPQRIYRPAVVEIEAVDARVPRGLRVAYVRGVGDNVAPAIEQLGVPVSLVGAGELARLDPSRTPVLVIGPRAYEANDTLTANASAVLDFARRGGTVVVQYGQHEMTQPGIMPYPITLERRADRVTEEDAPVRVLDPASPVLTYPNRITDRDFAGWVQERALYMPRTFDPRYHAPLSMNDPGEPPNQGAILVAPVGRGTYVYTTISFFRQLPAGHPGAARLFVNLLAAGLRPARQ